MYLRLGFEHVGVRKAYYPAPEGRREDAVVMSLRLDDAGGRWCAGLSGNAPCCARWACVCGCAKKHRPSSRRRRRAMPLERSPPRQRLEAPRLRRCRCARRSPRARSRVKSKGRRRTGSLSANRSTMRRPPSPALPASRSVCLPICCMRCASRATRRRAGAGPATLRSVPAARRCDGRSTRCAPRVALALGRAAAEALLGVDEPLGRLRGVVHEHDGVKVVVTFALAYLLRHPHEKAKAWADLCLAARSLEGEPVQGV